MSKLRKQMKTKKQRSKNLRKTTKRSKQRRRKKKRKTRPNADARSNASRNVAGALHLADLSPWRVSTQHLSMNWCLSKILTYTSKRASSRALLANVDLERAHFSAQLSVTSCTWIQRS